MKFAIKLISTLMVMLYPVGVYFGLQYFEPKYIGLGLIGLLLIRALTSKALLNKESVQLGLIAAAVGIVLGIYSYFSNSNYGIKLYPVVISLSLLAVFATSLYKPPAMIEKFARLQEPNLSEEAVIYTRTVTKIWCGFFVLNAIISLITAINASLEVWTFYNGFLSYILIGLLFSGEFAYRKLVLKV